MLVSIVLLWGVALWAFYRTLTDEDQKLDLLDRQGVIDTYSLESLRELRAWIENNPNDPMAEEARTAHDECVEMLREIDEPFYDWSEAEIDDLKTVSD